MKFRTRYGEKERTFSKAGCSVVPVYELVINESGKRGLKEVGKTDIQEEIDAAAPSVDIHIIMERFKNGDQEAIKQRAEVFYDDVSKMPTKLQDLMNLNIEAANFFDELPADLRKLYGNDYLQFLFDPGKMVDEMKKRESDGKESTKSGEEVKHDDPQQ